MYPKADWLQENCRQRREKCCSSPYILCQPGPHTCRRVLFGPSNAYYLSNIKARDSKAPLGLRRFADYTPLSTLYVVPKSARNPATGTLFVLWMTTPEAQAIRQPVDCSPTSSSAKAILTSKPEKHSRTAAQEKSPGSTIPSHKANSLGLARTKERHTVPTSPRLLPNESKRSSYGRTPFPITTPALNQLSKALRGTKHVSS